MNSAEARQILRRETAFAAKGIARKQTVSAFERLIKTNRGLIGDVVFLSQVEKVVAVCAATDDLRNSHHRHAAAVHAQVYVRPRDVLTQEQLNSRIDQVLRNDVTGKWIAHNLGVGWADRFRRIEGRIRVRAGGVIDGDASHAGVTG